MYTVSMRNCMSYYIAFAICSDKCNLIHSVELVTFHVVGILAVFVQPNIYLKLNCYLFLVNTICS